MGSQTRYATVVTPTASSNADWSLVGAADLVEALGAASGPTVCAESAIDPNGEGHTGSDRLKLSGFGFTVPGDATNLTVSLARTAMRQSGSDLVTFTASPSGAVGQPRIYDTASGSGFNAYTGASNMRCTDEHEIAPSGTPEEVGPNVFTSATWSNKPTFLTPARANSAGLTLEFGVNDAESVNATVRMWLVALTIGWDDAPSGAAAPAAPGAAHTLLAMGVLGGAR